MQVNCVNSSGNLFINNSGQLYAYGHNRNNRLGHCETLNLTKSKFTKELPAKVILAQVNSNYTLMYLDNGELWAAGISRNFYKINMPRFIVCAQVVQLSCGYNHYVLLTHMGKMFMYGNDITKDELDIVQHKHLEHKADYITCFAENLAFIDNGNLFVLGRNSYHKFGANTNSRIIIPTKILTGVSMVSGTNKYVLTLCGSTIMFCGKFRSLFSFIQTEFTALKYKDVDFISAGVGRFVFRSRNTYYEIEKKYTKLKPVDEAEYVILDRGHKVLLNANNVNIIAGTVYTNRYENDVFKISKHKGLRPIPSRMSKGQIIQQYYLIALLIFKQFKLHKPVQFCILSHLFGDRLRFNNGKLS